MIAGTMSGPSDISGAAEPLQETSDGVIVRVRVRPRASRRGVLRVVAGHLSVGVGAAPEKGRATEEAVRTLARWLGVAASRISIVSGATSRSKKVAITGVSAAEVRGRIAELPRADPS
jgi:hypothetical protein